MNIVEIEAALGEQQLGSLYSDLYKAAYGVRPRGELEWESVEAFETDWDRLVETMRENEEIKAERQRAAIETFEDRVFDYREIFPMADRADIIRYIAEAEDAMTPNGRVDFGFLEYKLNVPYGYIEGAQ